jgi:hypothetical protein
MMPRLAVALLLAASPCLAIPVVIDDPPRFQAGVDAVLQILIKGDPTLGSALSELVAEARRSSSVTGPSVAVQAALDASTQLEVEINPESRVKVGPGGSPSTLVESEWNYRLIKVVNLAKVTAPLRVSSPQSRDHKIATSRDSWFDIELFGGEDTVAPLTGAKVEYRVVRIRPNAAGKRAAVIAVDVGQGTADIGFRNDVLLTFNCSPRDR